MVVDCKTGAFHDEHRWQLSAYGHCAGTSRLTVFMPETAGARPLERAEAGAIALRAGRRFLYKGCYSNNNIYKQ